MSSIYKNLETGPRIVLKIYVEDKIEKMNMRSEKFSAVIRQIPIIIFRLNYILQTCKFIRIKLNKIYSD